MHIQHVGYNLIGGSNTAVEACIRAAEKYGHTSHCLAFTDRSLMQASIPEGWAYVPITDGIAGRAYGRVSRSVLRGFESAIHRADLVFIHLLYREHSAWAAGLARQEGKPVVIVPHGGLDPWVFSYRGLPKRVWLKVYREALFGKRCTTLFATDAEALKARSAISSSAERVIQWPAGRLTESPDGWARLRGTAPVRKLLYVGRLHPMKRLLETIRVLRRLNRVDWRLTIAGPPSTEISVETLKREAGELWEDQVKYLGPIERHRLGPLYADSDALVLFSHRENFGYVVAEAMCEGLPVAISDGVDLNSVVTRAAAGLVREVRTEDDIAEALTALLDLSSQELTAMGESGARCAAEEFGFEKFAASLNTMIDACVTAKASPVNLG